MRQNVTTAFCNERPCWKISVVLAKKTAVQKKAIGDPHNESNLFLRNSYGWKCHRLDLRSTSGSTTRSFHNLQITFILQTGIHQSPIHQFSCQGCNSLTSPPSWWSWSVQIWDHGITCNPLTALPARIHDICSLIVFYPLLSVF